jgi:hypothetical protein
MRLPLLLITSLLTITATSRATTWDEPWQETVVKDADTFIKATVVESSPKSITLKVLKHLAGQPVPDALTVDRFSLLHLGSYSLGPDGMAHELRFNFAKNEDWYFFLKKMKDKKDRDTWAIATPTAGFAGAANGNVYATYRHSYHQALVPDDLYEPSMTAIFQFLHAQKYDEKYVHTLIKTELSQPPTPSRKATPPARRSSSASTSPSNASTTSAPPPSTRSSSRS